MSDEIINRVAQSKLVTLDLMDYYPEGKRMTLDLKDWLYEGLVLREKEFRANVNDHDWSQYDGAYVALHCSSDAIIPGWAYMFISLQVQPFARTIVVGSINDLDSVLFKQVIDEINIEEFKDKPVIIKGCSDKSIPDNAYVWLSNRLKTVAKSIMYGEACSAVPLYKSKKSS